MKASKIEGCGLLMVDDEEKIRHLVEKLKGRGVGRGALARYLGISRLRARKLLNGVQPNRAELLKIKEMEEKYSSVSE